MKLVLVLGHTDCGAVRGAVDRVSGRYLPELFRKIEPAITIPGSLAHTSLKGFQERDFEWLSRQGFDTLFNSAQGREGWLAPARG